MMLHPYSPSVVLRAHSVVLRVHSLWDSVLKLCGTPCSNSVGLRANILWNSVELRTTANFTLCSRKNETFQSRPTTLAQFSRKCFLSIIAMRLRGQSLILA